MERPGNDSAYVSDTIERRCAFIQLEGAACSPDDMARLKTAGVKVNLFGTNDPGALKALYEAGVDFPLVDKTAGMMEAAKALGIEPVKPVY